MPLPKYYLLSNLLHLKVKCKQGLDHGIGIMGWMHPPVHRLLGWATKDSNLSLERNVWRLDQLKSITYQNAFVKGKPSQSDQATIDRFPTLLEADLLNINGEKIANIADLVFDIQSGDILYYLVARTNYKLPGTSRWRFEISKIIDQYDIEEILKKCIDEIINIQSNKPKNDVLIFDLKAIIEETLMFIDWYLIKEKNISISNKDRNSFIDIITSLYHKAKIKNNVYVHRDYHVDNIFYFPKSHFFLQK